MVHQATSLSRHARIHAVTESSYPSRRQRIALAVLIGVVSLAMSLGLTLGRQRADANVKEGADFRVPLDAAQAVLTRSNPYAAVRAQATPEDPGAAFYYPLPAALVAVPFTPFPRWLAGAVFFGLSSGLLAWLITRRSYDQLPLFFSTPFIFAAAAAQWSPFLMAVSFVPALSLGGRDDLPVQVRRHLFVVRELHVVRPAPAGRRGEVLLVGEHLGHRHLRADDGRRAARVHPPDPAAPAVQVAHQVPGVVAGRVDLDVHDRLEQRRPRP